MTDSTINQVKTLVDTNSQDEYALTVNGNEKFIKMFNNSSKT
nr:hypothetical protein [Mycoplasmopsis agalactiae]